MHVFIDDSDTFAKNGFLCLAGFIASDAAWDAFCIRWADLLQKHSIAVMHTAHFLSGQGIYRCLGHSYERRIEILSEFLDVIREETQCGIIAAVNAGDYREVLKSAKKKLQPEEFLFRRIIRRSFDYMVEIKSVESIGLWFDDSEKTSSRFLAIWQRTKKHWKGEKSMLGSIAFGDDVALPPLQAADVLANVLVRSHASGVDAWHGQSPFSRLFIDPHTRTVAKHIRAEIWEPKDVERMSKAILDLARER